jgi:hypothetical protein
LQVGIDDNHAFAILLSRDGDMNSKSSLAATAFLAEESDRSHL